MKLKLTPEDTLNSLSSECVRRLSNILEQVNLEELVKHLSEKQFFIPHRLEDIQNSTDPNKIYVIRSLTEISSLD